VKDLLLAKPQSARPLGAPSKLCLGGNRRPKNTSPLLWDMTQNWVTSESATIDSERSTRMSSRCKLGYTRAKPSLEVALMDPHYLWLTERLELLSFFVFGPVVSIMVAYRAWRKDEPRKSYVKRCVAFAVAFLLLFALAKSIHADVRTPEYFLQLTCVLLSFLSFGISQGYLLSALLNWWRWHNATRLK